MKHQNMNEWNIWLLPKNSSSQVGRLIDWSGSHNLSYFNSAIVRVTPPNSNGNFKPLPVSCIIYFYWVNWNEPFVKVSCNLLQIGRQILLVNNYFCVLYCKDAISWRHSWVVRCWMDFISVVYARWDHWTCVGCTSLRLQPVINQ